MSFQGLHCFIINNPQEQNAKFINFNRGPLNGLYFGLSGVINRLTKVQIKSLTWLKGLQEGTYNNFTQINTNILSEYLNPLLPLQMPQSPP